MKVIKNSPIEAFKKILFLDEFFQLFIYEYPIVVIKRIKVLSWKIVSDRILKRKQLNPKNIVVELQ